MTLLSDAHQSEVDLFYFSGVFFLTNSCKIVSLRIKTHNNTNLVTSRHIKREKGSRPVDVRRAQSKTSLLD